MKRALVAVMLAVLVLPLSSTQADNGRTIQPGDRVVSVSGWCTLNFVFDGEEHLEGKVFVGAAAHCLGSALGTYVWNPDVGFIGRIAYVGDYPASVNGGAPTDNGIEGTQLDFALIHVMPDQVPMVVANVRGQPGAPCGVAQAADAALGDRIAISGQGLVLSAYPQTRDNRSGVLIEVVENEWRGELPAVPGDSGGPITLDDCLALGVQAGTQAGTIGPDGAALGPPTFYGPTIEAILPELRALGWPVQLRLAS